MKIQITICIIASLFILSISIDNPKYDLLYQNKTSHMLKRQSMHQFRQVLDHYDYRGASYWNQRYWVINDYFNPNSGPIFLYICGEWVCDGVPQTRTWVGTLAQRLQGLILVLEHRFYGQSLPFGKDSFTIENMALLNSQQALRDLAYFIQTVKSNQMFGVTNNPWISVGGSYPGALSAWFRYKYPHLVIGAIASSAVILAVQDFQDFDEQIYLSSERSGSYCSNALNQSSIRVQSILNQGGAAAQEFKSQFKGGEKLTNKQFLFYWADAIVLTIQYGGRTKLCESLASKTADDQFKTIVENAKHYQVYQYGSYYLRNQTLTYLTQSAARPWYYQYCTEYAFFQTFSSLHPMRSKQLTLDFYSQFCSDAFGAGTWPKVERKNTEYGGLNEKSTNILFGNGIQDPWRWASLQQSTTQSLIARVIDCDNCAHCVDLHTPDAKDPESLKKVRNEQYLYLQEWIDQYWRQVGRRNIQSVLFSKTKKE